MSDLQTARLENWYLLTTAFGKVLYGNVFDHPRFENGTEVYTSVVKELDEVARTATTRNTIYTLGNPGGSSTDK